MNSAIEESLIFVIIDDKNANISVAGAGGTAGKTPDLLL
jgi:hypothetical protein